MSVIIVANGQLPGNSCNNNSCNNNEYLKTKRTNKSSQKRFVWNDVLDEVRRRKAKGQRANILSDTDKESETTRVSACKRHLRNKNSFIRYKLGAEYGNTYFTKREAECMKWLLTGETHRSIAVILKLSPRSVEYYVNNMKTKLGCRTQCQLIDLVRASEFMKNVKFFQ